jgi:methionyl aminopeptidase
MKAALPDMPVAGSGRNALREGDLVSIDVTVYREGVHGDTCVTVGVGALDPLSARLIAVTRHALTHAIAVSRPGAPVNAIGGAIEEVARPAGFGVVRDFVGHGVGAPSSSTACW